MTAQAFAAPRCSRPPALCRAARRAGARRLDPGVDHRGRAPDARARPGRASAALDDAAALGADGIRVVVLWRRSRPSPRRGEAPEGLRRPRTPPPTRPALGPARRPRARRAGARAEGAALALGPIPRLGVALRAAAASTSATCKPNAALFGAFVRALGTRYSGAYADEDQGGGVLPRVDRWSIWNEPNQPGWLTPQYESARPASTCPRRPTSTARSRARRSPACARPGHGRDLLLLGETRRSAAASAPALRGALELRALALPARVLPPDDVHQAPLLPGNRAARRLRAASRA